jgi:hypothetical protein
LSIQGGDFDGSYDGADRCPDFDDAADMDRDSLHDGRDPCATDPDVTCSPGSAKA